VFVFWTKSCVLIRAEKEAVQQQQGKDDGFSLGFNNAEYFCLDSLPNLPNCSDI